MKKSSIVFLSLSVIIILALFLNGCAKTGKGTQGLIFNVVLYKPLNGADLGSTNNADLHGNVTSPNGLRQCLLYTNTTGDFQIYSIPNNLSYGTKQFAGENNVSIVWYLNNLHKGTYKWNIKCTDKTGANISAPQNYTFSVSFTPLPTISVFSAPTNRSIRRSTDNIIIIAGAWTGMGLQQCSLYTNTTGDFQIYSIPSNLSYGTKQFAGATGVPNMNWTLSNLGIGTYKWNIKCTDTTGVNASSNILIFSIIPPMTINLISPADGDYLGNTTNVSFSLFASDYYLIQNCTLWTNVQGTWRGYSKNAAIPLGQNFTPTWNFTNIQSGQYIWNARCYNPYYVGSSPVNKTFYISSTPLNVTLIIPINNATITNPSVNFEVNASHDINLSNCTLYTDLNGLWMPNEAKQFTGIKDSDIWSVQGGTNGMHSWNARCCNIAGQCGYSPNNLTFTDLSFPPLVQLVSPLNNTLITSLTTNFTVTASDTLNLSSCTFYADLTGQFIPYYAKTFTGTTDTKTWNSATSINGIYKWNARCCNAQYNCGFSANNSTFTVVSSPPTVNLVSPTSSVQTENITFNASATDNAGLANCTLYTDLTGLWLPNETKQYTGTTDIDTWIFQGVINGYQAIPNYIYNWNAYCCNIAGLCKSRPSNATFKYEYKPPSSNDITVTLISPPTGSGMSNTDVEFIFKFTTSPPVTGTCTLWDDVGGFFTSTTYTASGTSGAQLYIIINNFPRLGRQVRWNARCCVSSGCAFSLSDYYFTRN